MTSDSGSPANLSASPDTVITSPDTANTSAFDQAHNLVQALRGEIQKVLIGQQAVVDQVLMALIARGHVLIEGVPGLGKTLLVRTLAQCFGGHFARIQFTPDLMPSDVTGHAMFNMKTQEFEIRKGPAFTNLLLADEINRAPAKTQAALLEVMQEGQITIEGDSHLVDAPFMVLATQNPIEQEGTYRLPEAQLDRFLFKIEVGYPTLEEEIQIISGHHTQKLDEQLNMIRPVLSQADILAYRKTVKGLHIEPKILEFIARIVHDTRHHPSLFLGASPRASLAIANGSKAIAVMASRDFVTPDDVIKVAPAVLCHRIMLTPEREMEGISTREVVQQIIKGIQVPR